MSGQVNDHENSSSFTFTKDAIFLQGCTFPALACLQQKSARARRSCSNAPLISSISASRHPNRRASSRHPETASAALAGDPAKVTEDIAAPGPVEADLDKVGHHERSLLCPVPRITIRAPDMGKRRS